MGNRKRHSKRQMELQPSTIKVGDSVIVKPYVDDPAYGCDISGWQGRITEIMTDEKSLPIVMIVWDSLTLRNIPEAYIKKFEREGLDWETMGVFAHQVELTQSRVAQDDVERAIEKISEQHSWAFLDEEGERIQEVLRGIKRNDDLAAFKAWNKYLHKVLALPFEGEVSEIQEGRSPISAGDRVTIQDFEDSEDIYGLMANIKTKRGVFNIPLCDLIAIDQDSSNYQPLNDYNLWFSNR